MRVRINRRSIGASVSVSNSLSGFSAPSAGDQSAGAPSGPQSVSMSKPGKLYAEPNLKSAVVRDLDQIRIAVRDEKLTYLGFSYGTFLGSTYADLYPDRIRALVLDGAVDATVDGLGEVQAQSFADAFSRFLADCASRPDGREIRRWELRRAPSPP